MIDEESEKKPFYKISYVNELRRKKNTWMMATILMFLSTIFLLVLYTIGENKIGGLEKRIRVFESAFATAEELKETKLFLPDG